jgi:hypothetical protein
MAYDMRAKFGSSEIDCRIVILQTGNRRACQRRLGGGLRSPAGELVGIIPNSGYFSRKISEFGVKREG